MRGGRTKTADGRPPALAYFLTNGRSLEDWARVGSLSRELSLLRRFADEGWRVSLYSYDKTRELPDVDFPLTLKPQWPYVWPKRGGPVYRALLPILRLPPPAQRPDVVMTNQAHGGWPALLAGRLWGAHIVARCGFVLGEREAVAGRRGPAVRGQVLKERLTFRHADRGVVPTAELADWVAAKYGLPRENIVVIPNFVDTTRFRPQPVRATTDVVSVGQLIERKRHHLLIEALQGTGLRLRIIGSGEERARLLHLAAERGVALEILDRVEHEDLPSSLAEARVFALASRWEGHPKALIEAMACGKACVGADAPGIKNLLVHGHTGLVVAPDAALWRATLLKLVADDAERERLGAAARAHALEHFSLERTFSAYRDLFDELRSQRTVTS